MIMADVISFKELRQKAGYKITKLAREANISPSSIYRIEDGDRVTRELVQSTLLVINTKLNTSYTVDDIRGLNLIE
jgi:DNA-binding XRE family transcriptional regulator